MQNSEAAEPQEVPKNHPTLWALRAHRTGNECPLFGLSMPDTWSPSAHLKGTDRPINSLTFPDFSRHFFTL